MKFDDEGTKTYKGDEPFVFLSYSHKDAKAAEALIRRLNREGFRIWYDEGIIPGTEFSLHIATQIENCHCLIALISNDYIESKFCKNELLYALENNITCLPVFLEKTELPKDMKLNLVSIRAVYRENYHNEEKFYLDILEAEGVRECRAEKHESPDPDVQDVQTKTVPSENAHSNPKILKQDPHEPPKPPKKPAGIIIAVLILALICAVGYIFAHRSSSEKLKSETAVETPALVTVESEEEVLEEAGAAEESASEVTTEPEQNTVPGAADLDAIDARIVYPGETEYLPEYRRAVIAAPRGYSVNSYASPVVGDPVVEVRDGTEVIVIASHKNLVCALIPSMETARWITETNLAYAETDAAE